MGAKRTPMRMCTGCREMKPKQQLIRVVRTPEGEIRLDPTGKMNGRGAYVCRSRECLARAAKLNSLAKAFETAVDKRIYERLGEELDELDG